MSSDRNPAYQRGTVYVCPMSQWGTSDIAGCLLIDTGEVLWDHISSSMGWLTTDLTSGFGDRRAELERRYPDGYEVVVAEKDEDIPAEVMARNKAWSEAQNTASQPTTDNAQEGS